MPPSTIRLYPEPLENEWLRQACLWANEEASELALEKLGPQVARLSDLFTTDRPDHFEDYSADAGLRTAYGLFYFPQSFVRAQFPLAEATQFRKWTPKLALQKPLKVLDLGAGLGGAGLGIAHYLQRFEWGQQIELTAVDHSSHSLSAMSQTVKACSSLWPKLTLNTVAQKAALFLDKQANTKYDLIVLGFSLNEMTSSATEQEKQQLLNQLKSNLTVDGLLLILEPALKETAQTLQQLSDKTLQAGELYSWGPYLNQHSCPLLAEGKSWNHEVRLWTPPGSQEFLNRRLHRSIRELKYSYTLLSPTPPNQIPEATNHFRLVSPLASLKGRIIASGVASDGQKYTYDIPTRGLKKSQLKALLAQYERGDILKVEQLEVLKQAGNFRINGFDTIKSHFHIE